MDGHAVAADDTDSETTSAARVLVTEDDVGFPVLPMRCSWPNPEQNRRIRRKTDRAILTILVWVYFLQVIPCFYSYLPHQKTLTQFLDS